MSLPLAILIATLLAHVVGATPFGFWVGKLRGIDIREHGSGNIGATNVFRVLGKKWGILTFFLDFVKGGAAIFLGRWLVADSLQGSENPEFWQAFTDVICGLAAILGHNHTFWLGFRGGKGVATSAGAVTAIMPFAFLTGLAVWIATFFTTRYVALASIAAGFAIPVALGAEFFLQKSFNWPHAVFALLVAVFCFVRHLSNLKRLRAGTEHRFPKRGSQRENSI